MYSNKENVNILTALLVEHGVRHAVVCPGSRNSPVVHNFNECPQIRCYPVTDERSAAFYALGMAQALQQPVAICVTSGTALLNLAPAVAEAYYQHVPMIVISADRPPMWIDQQDGQTLPQPDALVRLVKKAVTLPEPNDEAGHWYCNRLVNEAIISCTHQNRGPVHINVPISEPLFEYNVAGLPKERKIEIVPAEVPSQAMSHIGRMFLLSKKPMLICGQPMNPNLDEAVCLVENDESYVPDLVLYIGGSIVSKRLKKFLRKAKEVWSVNASCEVNDTFMNLTKVIQGDEKIIADYVHFLTEDNKHPFIEKWEQLLSRIRSHADMYQPAYSQMAAVKCFEEMIGNADDCHVHYGNSTAIRLANIFARHRVFCNRGVNGIEGSLSTAAGYSCAVDEPVYCVIGDLSFFYDQNALWNQNLRGNLRILLLNNSKGGIFNMLKGLDQSPARDRLIAGEHHTSAEGICRQNDVGYLNASNAEELQKGIATLIETESSRPVLLEVFTQAQTDEQVLKDYYIF